MRRVLPLLTASILLATATPVTADPPFPDNPHNCDPVMPLCIWLTDHTGQIWAGYSDTGVYLGELVEVMISLENDPNGNRISWYIQDESKDPCVTLDTQFTDCWLPPDGQRTPLYAGSPLASDSFQIWTGTLNIDRTGDRVADHTAPFGWVEGSL